MGRQKIPTKFAPNPAKRKSHFQKRREGLFKKAYELSVICGAQICLTVEDENQDLLFYTTNNSGKQSEFIKAASDIAKLLDRLQTYNPASEEFQDWHGKSDELKKAKVFQKKHPNCIESIDASVSGPRHEISMQQSSLPQKSGHNRNILWKELHLHLLLKVMIL